MRPKGDIADWWKAGTFGGKLRKLEMKQKERRRYCSKERMKKLKKYKRGRGWKRVRDWIKLTQGLSLGWEE